MNLFDETDEMHDADFVKTTHQRFRIHKHTDGKVTRRLSTPYLKKVDNSEYVVAEL